MTDRGVAIVTGGASGIGLAIAKALRGDGWKLVIADLAPGPLEAARAQLDLGWARRQLNAWSWTSPTRTASLQVWTAARPFRAGPRPGQFGRYWLRYPVLRQQRRTVPQGARYQPDRNLHGGSGSTLSLRDRSRRRWSRRCRPPGCAPNGSIKCRSGATRRRTRFPVLRCFCSTTARRASSPGTFSTSMVVLRRPGISQCGHSLTDDRFSSFLPRYHRICRQVSVITTNINIP